MIAVEWNDWDAPRTTDGKLQFRTGVLLHVGLGRLMGNSEPCNVAWVITKKLNHDEGNTRPGDKIVLVVQSSRLTIKGVHIPFDPYGAEN